MKGLVIGAGVTGCYTATRLMEMGVDVALLARGEKAGRLEREGLRLRDGLTEEEKTARPRIVRSPVAEAFDYVMVCAQEIHRPGLEPLLQELPGQPAIWFLGNTTKGFDQAGEVFGRDRVLGGFPGVGGTWDGEVLLYADRQKPADQPFDRLIIGEAFPEAAAAAGAIQDHLSRAGMKVERQVPIMAWHWSHVALVIPLAGAVYSRDGDLSVVVADQALLKQAMRATAQGMDAVRRAGYPVLPRGLNIMRWVPTWLGARKIGSLLSSRFGRIALAGHAATAREEMHSLAQDFLALGGAGMGRDLRTLLEEI